LRHASHNPSFHIGARQAAAVHLNVALEVKKGAIQRASVKRILDRATA
jgi:hypothetical protein